MTALLLSAAALGAVAGPVSADPYPPTVPCSLSWAQDGLHRTVLVGSGYDENQAVSVTAYPAQSRIGSFPTDAAGGFAAPVDPAAARAAWVVAASADRRCSVASPPAGGPGTAPVPPATSSPGSVAPPAAGSGGTGSGGTGPGNSSGTAAYPPGAPTTAATSTAATRPGSGPSSRPPAGSSAAPSSPRPSATGTRTAEPRSTAPLDLPLAAVIGIAALLLLGGAVAVVVLTRRTG